MYETADMFSHNKEKVAARIVKEYRAGLIPETPDRNRASSEPRARRTTPAATAAPLARKKTYTCKAAAELDKTVKDNVRKCDEDIKKLNARMAQISRDITSLSIADKNYNYDAIVALREELRGIPEKIKQLEAIKQRSLQLLGGKK